MLRTRGALIAVRNTQVKGVWVLCAGVHADERDVNRELEAPNGHYAEVCHSLPCPLPA